MLFRSGFGLDFDIERGNSGGEITGEALTGEWVEEVKPKLIQSLEPAPPLCHSYARLLYTPTKHTRYVSHFSFSLCVFEFFLKLRPSNRLSQLGSLFCLTNNLGCLDAENMWETGCD